ncbi:type VI secretion system baseplate subunit TssF [Acidisoma cellulosilytica]|uniref:Type VI secretion system baseplate subunit TssF n=1 Tax=Acidisoma cellulosilyticum TaxID=2802395 RepID=A0A964E3V4_9PROT|nr:type VI secretion system baseplate subunit TssF [Acidisoma cellulosilyticum]MCB8881040.1 type VI secretion system baseplate subunit TssF [Acidisoma cellulosilyticum]
MSDSLLPYYDRELAALRELAAEFGEANPKAAGRLRMGQDAVDDPHVGRMLEGVAFLAGRVHRRLDDEFPELTDALLGILYPHYLAPLPSAAIARLTCQPDVRVPVVVPRGTAIETDPIEGEPCRFRTTAEVKLWPIALDGTRLSGLPLTAPVNPQARGARSTLRFVLKTLEPETAFADLDIDRLRLYLRGPIEQSLQLYELICGHALGLALADGPNDQSPTLLPASAIQPAGFTGEEALYPWSSRSFSGFRLLTEYFALPEKFLFIDLLGLDARTMVHARNQLEVFIYLDCALPELERALRPDVLALGCVPMVNLFPRQCEPVALTHERSEYPVTADYRRPRSLEIWRIESVRELHGDGSSRPWRPFYRHAPHDDQAEDDEAPLAGLYNVARRDAAASIGGTEVFLAPMDPALSVDRPADTVLSIDATCSNRDLPARLPFGGDQPRLHLSDGLSSVADLACLTPPTASLRRRLHDGRAWGLISHLSLSHLSVVGGAAGAESLREMLRLYDPYDNAETRAAIAGLIAVNAKGGTARVPGARPGAFCRGLDVELVFDPKVWHSSGLYLMASVLERFLALHATINSFVRTTAVLQGRPGSVARFPPRAGARVLL